MTTLKAQVRNGRSQSRTHRMPSIRSNPPSKVAISVRSWFNTTAAWTDRIASGDFLAATKQIAGAVGVGEIDRKDDRTDGDEEIVNLPAEIEAAQSAVAVKNLLSTSVLVTYRLNR